MQRSLKRQPVQVHIWDGNEDAMREFAPDHVIGFTGGKVIFRTLLTEGLEFSPGSMFVKIPGCSPVLNFCSDCGVPWEELLLEPETADP